jgi:hypothetical protein
MTTKGQPKPAIELHIEELVLQGFGHTDQEIIARALERALTQLLAEGGLASWMTAHSEMSVVDAGSIELLPGTPAEIIGARVARTVYGGPPGGAKEK